MPDTTVPTISIRQTGPLTVVHHDWTASDEAMHAAIRRERRPLPSHELNGVKVRQWAAAVLGAEIKHGVSDFWRCVHELGFGSRFDDRDYSGEAAPFRFDHERSAALAYRALSALNLHDGDARGPWARSMTWGRKRWREWAKDRHSLTLQFREHLAEYRRLRAEVETPPVAREAA